MTKWVKYLLITLVLVLTLPLAYSQVFIEYGLDNTTWYNATEVKQNEGQAYVTNLEEGQLYYFRVKNSTSDWNYFTHTTTISGEKGMSSLAIIGFMTMLSLGLIFLPRMVGQFSSNFLLDYTLKGISVTLGLFFLTLETAMVTTVSSVFGIGVETELFTILWIVQKAAYLAMVIVVLGYGYQALKMMQEQKLSRRMGNAEE